MSLIRKTEKNSVVLGSCRDELRKYQIFLNPTCNLDTAEVAGETLVVLLHV
jgi:hypothetical protein